MKRKPLLLLLCLLTVLTIMPINASAAMTETIDMIAINEHNSGVGYKWDNSERILSLENLNLTSTAYCAIRIPEDSTIELKGDNTINAADIAIQCYGSLTVTGSGTLTVNANDTAIKIMTSDQKANLIFREGEITVNSKKTGINSGTATAVFTGSEVKINADNTALIGRRLDLVGGTLACKGNIRAEDTIEINAINLTVSAPEAPAISAPNGIKLNEVKISVGQNTDSLQSADSYNGEAAAEFKSTAKFTKKGFLFGGKLPAFVDYIVLTLIVLALGATVAVPLIIKKKKTDALVKQSEFSERLTVQKKKGNENR